MLTVEEVAAHYGLRPDTVRRKVRSGELQALRVGRLYRMAWPDVWAAEEGSAPKGARAARYQEPLLSKRRIANALSVSVKTVERWLAGGLPTRNVFGAVRCNPHDIADWLRVTMDIDLPGDWWK